MGVLVIGGLCNLVYKFVTFRKQKYVITQTDANTSFVYYLIILAVIFSIYFFF